ncbi:MAG: acyl carrier protein [Xanthomonadales bacterium]|nr:acyl carrier protein [Xanthomonadales bacterium]
MSSRSGARGCWSDAIAAWAVADDTLRGPNPLTPGYPVTIVQESKSQSPAEQELARLVVSSLNIEGVQAEAIDPEAPLFGEGDLGLDSIDALELALAVSKHYGFQLRSDNPENRQIFGSLRALSAHIEQQRAS